MIQIDMSIPTTCFDCPACNEYLDCAIPVSGRKWGENDVSEFSQGRPEWCPMKEQEAVAPIPPTDESDLWKCGNCNHQLFRCTHQRYCEMCGREVKWE